MVHYRDDFLVMGSPATNEYSEALKGLLNTFELLGLPVTLNKLEGTAQKITFLGFELDTEAL